MSVPVVTGGAERAFQVFGIVTDEPDVVRASMPTGPWLADRFGTPLAGALGVLVDDGLGYALVRARADDRWSVSSEITIDAVHPFDVTPAAGPLQAATTGPPLLDDLGGRVSGRVSDGSGATVAVCAQRGRWIPFDGELDRSEPPVVDGASCVEDLLGAAPETVEGGARLRLVVGPALANPLGNLHGGLSLCASDLAASAAVPRWDTPWRTESLRVQYLRPVPAGSTVEFTAVVRHAGRTRAVVDVTGTVDGRLCTYAHVSGRPG